MSLIPKKRKGIAFVIFTFIAVIMFFAFIGMLFADESVSVSFTPTVKYENEPIHIDLSYTGINPAGIAHYEVYIFEITNGVLNHYAVYSAAENLIGSSSYSVNLSTTLPAKNNPPLDYYNIDVYVSFYGQEGGDILLENFTVLPARELKSDEETKEEPVWIRTMPMTCYRVWINEDNNFQFIFWYPYRDNNWVKIYDASGKIVYEIDMPYDNPNIIVDLPNGMYTVKTFTVGSTEPIQSFVIGK